MNHASLFSGIGGCDLAAQWMGWHNVFHCEYNPFCKEVLKYHFKDSVSYDDITKTDFTIHRGQIDVLTGGFPCQPFSAAGKRKGIEDERYLWDEMFRAIREIKPCNIVGENVRGLTNWNGGMVFDKVQDDLEAEGYEVLPFILPSVGIGSNHRRERIWFVAHAISELGKVPIQSKNNGNSNGGGQESQKWSSNRKKSELASCFNPVFEGWESFPKPHFMDDGFSERLDTTAISEKEWVEQSLMASGNAIMPQMALRIFEVIEKMKTVQFI